MDWFKLFKRLPPRPAPLANMASGAGLAMTIKRLPRSFWSFAMANKISIFFILILLVSFSWHIYHRNDHFQECDSTQVFPLIKEFPQSQLSFLAGYNKGSFISTETASWLFHQPIVKFLKEKYVQDINGKKIDEAALIKKITATNPLGLARLGLVSGVASINPPNFIKGFFGLPWGSTYSAGSGLFYGLLTTSSTSYNSFMSRSLILTLLLFHLSVIILFFTCLELGVSPVISFFTSLLMLFSISMYSYGYHLGNTVWNYSTSFLFVWFLIKNQNHPNLLKKISYLTAILIFFNYLIVFYWLAFLMAYLFWEGYLPKMRKVTFLRDLAMTQWLAILSIITCTLLFYPPGQGNRGTTSLRTFLSDVYYIVLNFFSFYNTDNLINNIQFVIGIIFIGLFLYYLISGRWRTNEKTKLFSATALFVLFLFALAALLGVLGFAPTRHLLFLAPVVFVGVGLVVQSTLQRLPRPVPLLSKSGTGFAMIVLVIFGFWSLNQRSLSVVDKLHYLPLNDNLVKGVDKIFIERCIFQLWYDDTYKNFHLPVEFDDPRLFKKEDTYLYIGQTKFSDIVNNWNSSDYYNVNIKADVLYNFTDFSSIFFTAYNPGEGSNEQFHSTRPNRAYLTKFKVISLSKKYDK